jgi:hypothetical protein
VVQGATPEPALHPTFIHGLEKKKAIFMAARFQPIKTSHFAIEAKRRWTWALGEVSPSDLKIRSDLS